MSNDRDPSVVARHALVGQLDVWRMKRQFQIDFLMRQGLLPEHRLLDLGCGTLRGGIPIIEYLSSGNYTGIEVRREVLEEGRKELLESNLRTKLPTLLCTEKLDAVRLHERFDIVWAFSVLIHLSDAILETALATISRHLSPNGRFLGNVNIGSDEDGQWQGFPVVCRPWEFYRSAFLRHGMHAEDIGSLHDWGHQIPHQDRRRAERQRMLAARPVRGKSD